MNSFQATQPGVCDLPGWVERIIGPGDCEALDPEWVGASLVVRRKAESESALFSGVIRDAVRLDAEALRDAVHRVYAAILNACTSDDGTCAIRYWNFLPAIHEPMAGDLDRYKVFNLGRHDAMSQPSINGQVPDGVLPTATAVGHGGTDLWIHCLTGPQEPTNLENPRQIPAYRYSAKYGPRPPCFSRASLATVGGESMLIVGGTSSVRGERSVHRGDIRRQLDETFENLRAIAHAGLSRLSGDVKLEDSLDRLTHVRAYYLVPEERGTVEEVVNSVLRRVGDVEFVQADLCRSELRIEIEGLASVDRTA